MKNQKPKLQASAQAFFTYAEAYALSAKSLADARLEMGHAEAPIRMLFFHAIELYLKAFLVVRGQSAELLKRRAGHNFEKLITLATNEGLPVELNDKVLLAEAYHSDAIFQARYLEPEAPGKIIFDVELLCRITCTIRNALCEHPDRVGQIIIAGEGKR